MLIWPGFMLKLKLRGRKKTLKNRGTPLMKNIIEQKNTITEFIF